MAAINTMAIPPRISARIQSLIVQRDAKQAERREFREYNGFDDFSRRQNQAEKATLDNAVKELEGQILELARKYMSGMAVVTGNAEETIARILTALPVEQLTKMATFVNARMQQVP